MKSSFLFESLGLLFMCFGLILVNERMSCLNRAVALELEELG
jgi:hypothetical protein